MDYFTGPTYIVVGPRDKINQENLSLSVNDYYMPWVSNLDN